MSSKKRKDNKHKLREENLKQAAEDYSTELMARILAAQADMDKVTALKVARKYRLQATGEFRSMKKGGVPGKSAGEMFDEDAGYPEKRERYKKLLKLQQLFGGAHGDIGGLPAGGADILLNFNFPVDYFFERIAQHWSISTDSVEKMFREELGQAFDGMMETGVGELPSFGSIRLGGEAASSLIFDLSEELKELFEEDNGD